MKNCRHPRLLITALVWSLIPPSVETKTKLLAKEGQEKIRPCSVRRQVSTAPRPTDDTCNRRQW